VPGTLPAAMTPGCLSLMSHLPATAFARPGSQFSRSAKGF
jgi:hypothetical protein